MSSLRGDALRFYGVPSETAHVLHAEKERRSIRFQTGARSRETEKQVGEIMQKTIIFIDCGDTIVDERTQVYAGEPENSPVLRADFIPGADEMIRSLYESGHDIVLVADGLVASFENILRENGLYPFFKAKIYSEAIGAGKPSGRMFCAAMGALELTEADKRRIIMVGNNLRRDIKGANAAGITSVSSTGRRATPSSRATRAKCPITPSPGRLSSCRSWRSLTASLPWRKKAEICLCRQAPLLCAEHAAFRCPKGSAGGYGRLPSHDNMKKRRVHTPA